MINGVLSRFRREAQNVNDSVAPVAPPAAAATAAAAGEAATKAAEVPAITEATMSAAEEMEHVIEDVAATTNIPYAGVIAIIIGKLMTVKGRRGGLSRVNKSRLLGPF